MATLLLTHPACHDHHVPAGHPESPARLRAVEALLETPPFAGLWREEAPEATREHLLLAHDIEHVREIEGRVPEDGLSALDADTWLSPGSFQAARHAAGAVIRATQAVAMRDADNAFCAARPPGHHAERARAMGFCLFNNVAIGAAHALEHLDAERVAIVDFDVHHGNGTQSIFWDDPRVLYCSSHQMPAYPGSGDASETGAHGNIVNCPLPPQADGRALRAAYLTRILPALDDFAPEMLFISAGFDAHAADPLASLRLREEDFAWLTMRLMEIAARHCAGRIVSVLEGGYDVRALAASVGVHVRILMQGAGG